MRQNLPNIALFLVLAAVLLGGGYLVEKTFFPPPPPKPVRPPVEAAEALVGTVIFPTAPVADWRLTTLPPPPAKAAEPTPPPTPAAAPTPAGPAELIALGDTDSFVTRVLLTTRGGAVQQVTLRDFEEANRLGREVTRPDGSVQALRLIPGQKRPRNKDALREPDGGAAPDLKPGKVPNVSALAEPSYVVLHYPDAGRQNPSAELGDRNWDRAPNRGAVPDGAQQVTFETTLGAPYHLKLRKTFTLSPGDYHVGFQFDVEGLPERKAAREKFRYQVAGPLGLPVEGEWYAQGYRSVYVGTQSASGSAHRTVEDAATIHTQHGGAIVPKGADPFTYAAVGTQYFASALAVDDSAPADARNVWDYVRPTREPRAWDDPAKLFLGDVTFRAVSVPVDPAPGETVSHKYLIYNGPMKVRLLKQVVGKPINGQPAPDPVRPELVDRYLDALSLRTLTDYQSPTKIGQFAATIGWSSVVISFTNVMHGLLGFLNRHVPSWGLDIILLTVMVRLLLFIPSRKQQASMAAMQAKQAAMKPELDKLTEKYKDDPARLQQEKTRLMLAHGVNPLTALGGCLLLFAQMPIFMGLYFCLQESVFFRLQPFLGFIPNLAAPDMTVWWSERIPFLSVPDALGGTLYLGPFLNVLPLIAVGLIFLQQYITMPPPADEQQEMQQKMMKFMVLFMAVFFYKVPAGLCVYFICSTTWAILERKLIKKPTPPPVAAPTPGANGPVSKSSEPAKPAGGVRGWVQRKVQEAQRQADEQAKRQIRNDPPGANGNGRPGARGGKRRRK